MKSRSTSVVPWPVIRNLAMALVMRLCTSWIGLANRREASSISPAAAAASAVRRVAAVTRAASACPKTIWPGAAENLSGAPGDFERSTRASAPAGRPRRICMITGVCARPRKPRSLPAPQLRPSHSDTPPGEVCLPAKLGHAPIKIDGLWTVQNGQFEAENHVETLRIEGSQAVSAHGDFPEHCA
jgi:hypothetical protein